MVKNILVVDDHKMFGEGLITLLSGEPEYSMIGTVITRGKEVIPVLNSIRVDIVFLDIDMPDINGIELAQLIKKQFPHIRILIISMHIRADYFKELYDIGVSGYLVKNAGKEEILKALKEIEDGKMYNSQDIINKFLKAKSEDENVEYHVTNRERDVLKLVVEGKSTKEISEELHISTHTVDTHRKNLLCKLCVKNTAELVQMAIKEGMV